ncbi:flavin-containing monooxygenase 5-like [Siphateles boraxobius]|uniref:flavin-containing monooxygenase 5-like n=1 Tax=Siphateles boraxobius TaxID=180520 RepID=UPI0040640C9A
MFCVSSTKVLHVTPRPDFPHSGQWDVETESKDGGREKQVFDAVMVCTGHHCHPHLPLKDFPGIDTFKGKFFHSRDYKNPEEWRGKRVVVIGIGNSGGDIAVELSRMAKQVYLSTRKGSWILNCVGDNGVPSDMMFKNRVSVWLILMLPVGFINNLKENQLNEQFNHKLYGLQPRHSAAVCSVLQQGQSALTHSRPFIAPRQDQGFFTIASDHKAGVCGSRKRRHWPYTSKCATTLTAPTPGHCGLQGTLHHCGHVCCPPGPPCTESGRLNSTYQPVSLCHSDDQTMRFSLPGAPQCPFASVADKDAPILRAEIKIYAHFELSAVSLQLPLSLAGCPSSGLYPSIAEEMGVFPNIAWLLLRDPAVGLRAFFGPCTPYQFRLSGPGYWRGARQAILTQWERVAKPMKARPIPEPSSFSLSFWLGLSRGAAMVFAIIAMQKKIPLFLRNTSVSCIP